MQICGLPFYDLSCLKRNILIGLTVQKGIWKMDLMSEISYLVESSLSAVWNWNFFNDVLKQRNNFNMLPSTCYVLSRKHNSETVSQEKESACWLLFFCQRSIKTKKCCFKPLNNKETIIKHLMARWRQHKCALSLKSSEVWEERDSISCHDQ